MTHASVEPPPERESQETPPERRPGRGRSAKRMIVAGCVLALPLVWSLLTMPGPKGGSIFTAAPVQSSIMLVGLALIYLGARSRRTP